MLTTCWFVVSYWFHLHVVVRQGLWLVLTFLHVQKSDWKVAIVLFWVTGLHVLQSTGFYKAFNEPKLDLLMGQPVYYRNTCYTEFIMNKTISIPTNYYSSTIFYSRYSNKNIIKSFFQRFIDQGLKQPIRWWLVIHRNNNIFRQLLVQIYV